VALVVCVTCKNKHNGKSKNIRQPRTFTTTVTKTTTITITEIKRMKIAVTGNRKKMSINFCFYEQNIDKQQR